MPRPVRFPPWGEGLPAAFLSCSRLPAAAAVPRGPRRRYTNRGGRPCSLGAAAMTLSVEAVYEDGVLKPAQPLPFPEHEKVRVTILPAVDWVQQTYGLCGWKGDP